jgi:hypothetical protein
LKVYTHHHDAEILAYDLITNPVHLRAFPVTEKRLSPGSDRTIKKIRAETGPPLSVPNVGALEETGAPKNKAVLSLRFRVSAFMDEHGKTSEMSPHST